MFDAACIGLRLRLNYSTKYAEGVRLILACNPRNQAEVESVADYYRGVCTAAGAKVSWKRFCADYDERRGGWLADQDGTKAGGVAGALWTGNVAPLCDVHRGDPKGCRLCIACADNQPEQNRTAAYWSRKGGDARG